MHKEKDVTLPWIIILICTLLSYLVLDAYVIELRNSESIQGNLLFHANQHSWFEASLNGQGVNHSPIFTWFCALFSSFGVNNLTLRLPSILALLGMSGLSFFTSYKLAGKRAAWPAFAICLSSIAALKMSLRSDELMLSSFFMSAAWCSWFLISRKPKKWLAAWITGLSFTSLAAALSGPHMYLMFYVPLLFMTRPTDVRKRLLHSPHLIAVALIGLLVLCLHSLLKSIAPDPNYAFSFFSTDLHSFQAPIINFDQGYISSVIKFPIRSLIAFMPWPFVAWTGFCEAFRIIEKNSVAGMDIFRFMRRICISIFFLFMFYPESDYYSLLPLIVPLAILGGLHYSVFIRRHYKAVRTTVNILNGTCVIAGSIMTSMVVYRLQKSISEYQSLRLTNALYFSAAAIVLGLIIVSIQRRKNPLWLRAVLIIIIMHSLVSAGNHLQYHNHKYSAKAFADELRPLLPEGHTLYNFTDKKLYRESFYLRRPVKNISKALKADDLPKVVYVLSGSTKPVQFTSDSTYYHWQAISQESNSENDDTIILYKGSRDVL
jgi:4-amino-4-deoxy-L-arabinose transferase-like glycosyltransferase